MRLILRRPRDLALALRDLAKRRPRQAEEYLEEHGEEWGSLAEAEPQNAADILEAIDPAAAVSLVGDLEVADATDVVAEMHPESGARLIAELPPSEAAALVALMDDDDAADVLGHLDSEQRTNLLAALPVEVADRVTGLLAYPPDTAGGLMTTEAASLNAGLTCGEAIETLRQMHETLAQLNYVYVIDSETRLQGVISFRDMVFARPDTPIEEAMIRDPVAVRPDLDREEVAQLIQRYGLLSLPVVDFRQRLLGIITVDEALEAVQEEAGEDIAAMVGAGVGETIHTQIPTVVRNRLPWILVNLATAFLVTAIVSRFEPLISKTAILAAYMPVIASMGGNSGAQSLAVVIRTLAIEEIPGRQGRRVIRREIFLGALNGLITAAVAGLIAGGFTNSARIGFIIGLAGMVNMTVAGLAGAGIPILLQRLRQDPALASNIFLTTVTDVVGFGGFLFVAWVLL